jgi:hypothetical protein
MKKIGLTDFVDVVSKSGTPKATKIKEIINRPEYHPATDYYKAAREWIREVHEKEHGKKKIDELLLTLNDHKKLGNYTSIIKGYKKWWGNKDIEWFQPTSGAYSSQDISISVNPELGLIINGNYYLIKLYFKDEKLSKTRVDIVTFLMDKVLRENSREGTIMSILDVRSSKMFLPQTPIVNLTPMINGELAYISAFLSSL